MASETTTTTLTELMQAAIGEARIVETQGADFRDHVTHRPNNGSDGVTFPIYDTATFASVAEATDLTNSAFQTTDVTLTPGERGLMGTLTDLAKLRTGMQAAIDIGKVMGQAHKDLINQDFFGLMDGFTTHTPLGSSNVNITLAVIRQARATLVQAKAPAPYFLPITSWIQADIIGLYNTTSFSPEHIMTQAMTTGILPMLEGVTPILIDNLAEGTSTGEANAADLKIGLYSKAALGYVEEWDFKIETERDASLRADELVATASYAAGEIKDNWGIEILVDNKD